MCLILRLCNIGTMMVIEEVLVTTDASGMATMNSLHVICTCY
jgi:hypothetical protein